MTPLAHPTTAEIFTIPAADWTAINKRVGTVLVLEPLAAIVSKTLPGYPDLLASSRSWMNSTYDGLVSQSWALADYAGRAITTFGDLSAGVKQVPAGATPSPPLQELVSAALAALAESTGPLAAAFHSLSGQVQEFLSVNKAVDTQFAASEGAELGVYWAPVAAQLALLENAVGWVMGDWNAITSDLVTLQRPAVDVTMEFIELLQLDAAVVAWTAVRTEAAAFSAKVEDQKQYWSNPFRGG
jgi:hypothetical protein